MMQGSYRESLNWSARKNLFSTNHNVRTEFPISAYRFFLIHVMILCYITFPIIRLLFQIGWVTWQTWNHFYCFELVHCFYWFLWLQLKPKVKKGCCSCMFTVFLISFELCCSREPWWNTNPPPCGEKDTVSTVKKATPNQSTGRTNVTGQNGHTLVTINSRVCNNLPLDTLSIESITHHRLETTYYNVTHFSLFASIRKFCNQQTLKKKYRDITCSLLLCFNGSFTFSSG